MIADNGKVNVANVALKVLSAEDILSSGRPQPFEIEELDGIVFLRSLPTGKVLDYTEKAKDDPTHQALLELISAAVVNENGAPLFSESQISRLRDISISVFNKLSSRVLEMAGLADIQKKEGEA